MMKVLKITLLLTFFCNLFFLSPLFANDLAEDTTGRDDTQVYHVYDNIDLVSTMKFKYGSKPKIMIKYVYPQLEVDSDSAISNAGVDNFNQLVMNLIQKEIADFQQQVSAQNPARQQHKNELVIDYDTSVIKADDEHLISIRFSIQQSISGMVHPYHYHRVLNFNLDNNEVITLADLFTPNSDYLDLLSKYSQYALGRRLSDKQMIATGTTATAAHFANWNIKPNGLLITFDDYQVAPYVNGAQTILVPYGVLKEIVAADSPVEYCLNHRRKCASSNLLTGGFIDEAINAPHRFLNPILGKA